MDKFTLARGFVKQSVIRLTSYIGIYLEKPSWGAEEVVTPVIIMSIPEWERQLQASYKEGHRSMHHGEKRDRNINENWADSETKAALESEQ